MKLWAAQALEILRQMNMEDDWKLHGFMVGEPAYRFVVGKLTEEGKPALTNQNQLSPEQAQELFDYIQQNEELLQTMAEKEEEDKRRILAHIYRLLLRAADAKDKK